MSWIWELGVGSGVQPVSSRRRHYVSQTVHIEGIESSQMHLDWNQDQSSYQADVESPLLESTDIQSPLLLLEPSVSWSYLNFWAEVLGVVTILNSFTLEPHQTRLPRGVELSWTSSGPSCLNCTHRWQSTISSLLMTDLLFELYHAEQTYLNCKAVS